MSSFSGRAARGTWSPLMSLVLCSHSMNPAIARREDPPSSSQRSSKSWRRSTSVRSRSCSQVVSPIALRRRARALPAAFALRSCVRPAWRRRAAASSSRRSARGRGPRSQAALAAVSPPTVAAAAASQAWRAELRVRLAQHAETCGIASPVLKLVERVVANLEAAGDHRAQMSAAELVCSHRSALRG